MDKVLDALIVGGFILLGFCVVMGRGIVGVWIS